MALKEIHHGNNSLRYACQAGGLENSLCIPRQCMSLLHCSFYFSCALLNMTPLSGLIVLWRLINISRGHGASIAKRIVFFVRTSLMNATLSKVTIPDPKCPYRLKHSSHCGNNKHHTSAARLAACSRPETTRGLTSLQSQGHSSLSGTRDTQAAPADNGTSRAGSQIWLTIGGDIPSSMSGGRPPTNTFLE